MYMYMYVYPCICTYCYVLYVYMYMYILLCIHVRICIQYMYIYIYMYVYMYVYMACVSFNEYAGNVQRNGGNHLVSLISQPDMLLYMYIGSVLISGGYLKEKSVEFGYACTVHITG